MDSVYARIPGISLVLDVLSSFERGEWKQVVILWIPRVQHLRTVGFGRVAGGTESRASKELAWNPWQRTAPR